MPHEEECPLFGKEEYRGMRGPGRIEFAVLFAAHYAATQQAQLAVLTKTLPCGHKAANLYEAELNEWWDACPICAMMKGAGARAEAAESALEQVRKALREARDFILNRHSFGRGVRAKKRLEILRETEELLIVGAEGTAPAEPGGTHAGCLE
jgi:hypothetical protein